MHKMLAKMLSHCVLYVSGDAIMISLLEVMVNRFSPSLPLCFLLEVVQSAPWNSPVHMVNGEAGLKFKQKFTLLCAKDSKWCLIVKLYV